MQYKLDNLTDLHNRGWIRVSSIDDRIITLPHSTKIVKAKNLFVVTEGFYKNTTITLTDRQVVLYVRRCEMNIKAFNLTFNLSNGVLDVPELGKFKLIFKKDSISEGEYKLLVPYYPHNKNLKTHLDETNGGSRFANTWFQLFSPRSTIKDTFFHLGTYTKGCLTFPYVRNGDSGKKWNKIYLKLMNSRFDRYSLALLTVVK